MWSQPVPDWFVVVAIGVGIVVGTIGGHLLYWFLHERR